MYLMFTNMCMTNFKSWKETGDIRLAPLTGFFGANSSGKSSLLQMLLLLKQTTESNDRNLVLKTGSIQDGYVTLGTPAEITYDDTTDMTLQVAWDLATPLIIPIPDEDRTIELTHLDFETQIHAEPQKVHVTRLAYTSDDNLSVALERRGNNQYTIRMDIGGIEPRRAQGRPRVYMRPEKCYGFSDEALRFYQDTSFLSDIVLQFEQQFQQLHYLGPLREYPQRTYVWGGERPTNVGLKGELAVSALLASKNEKVYPDERRGKHNRIDVIIAEWMVKLGLAHAFQTRQLMAGSNQYEVRLRRQEHSPEVLITDMGIGVSQILPVLVLCYYVPPGSTIILEQPELHLHPSVQSGLADVFIDVIQRRHVQIMIESHSEHLLRRLQRRIAEEQISREDAALYFCDLQNGSSQLHLLDIDLFGQIRNWPSDFFGDVAGDLAKTLDAGLERQMSVHGDA